MSDTHFKTSNAICGGPRGEARSTLCDNNDSKQIADLYKKQQQIQNQGEKADLEDYY